MCSLANHALPKKNILLLAWEVPFNLYDTLSNATYSCVDFIHLIHQARWLSTLIKFKQNRNLRIFSTRFHFKMCTRQFGIRVSSRLHSIITASDWG